MKSYFAKNNVFYGYFDIMEDYSDIEISISLEKNLGSVITNCVYAARDMETAWAGVRNSVTPPDDVDADQWFGDLKNEVYQLATEVPETIETVMKTIQAAGKANVDPENIVEFSKAVLQLKEASNGAFSESEIINYFDAFQSAGIASYDEVDNWASAVLALRETTSASEKDILKLSSSIASVGKDTTMSSDQILAWGGYMADVGIESGAIFMRMTSKIREFVTTGDEKLNTIAETAGMSADAFADAWKTDASGALESFVTGLGNLDKNSEEYNTALQDMGLNSGLYTKDVSKLTSSTSELSDTLGTAKTAFAENTDLIEGAATAADTLDSRAQMFENTLTIIQAQLGDSLLPILEKISDVILPILSGVSEFITKHPRLAAGIAGIAAAFYILSMAVQVASIAMTIGASAFTPWLLVAGAIGLAIAGIIGLVDLFIEDMQTARTEVDETFKHMEELSEDTRQLTEDAVAALMENSDYEYTISTGWETDAEGNIFEAGVTIRYDVDSDSWVTLQDDIDAYMAEHSVELPADLDLPEDEIGSTIEETTDQVTSSSDQVQSILGDLNETITSFTDSTNQLGDSMSGELSESMETLGTLLSSEEFQQFAKEPVDPAVAESWQQFGESVSSASEGFGEMAALFGIGEEVEGQAAGMTFEIPPVDEATIVSWQLLALAVRDVLNAFTGGGEEEQPGQQGQQGQQPGQKQQGQQLGAAEGMAEGMTGGLSAAFAALPEQFKQILKAGQDLAAFFTDDFVNAINAVILVLAVVTIDEEGTTDASEGNTLYTSLGAVYGLFLDICDVSQRLAQIWTGTLVEAILTLKERSQVAIDTCNSLAGAANGAADAFWGWARAIWAVIDALQALDGMGSGGYGGGGGGGGGAAAKLAALGGMPGKSPAPGGAAAEGAHVHAGETWLVGEEGPELFTPKRSGYIIPNDELGSSEGSEGGQTINIHFDGPVYGEKYLKDYVTKTMMQSVRKELRVAG